MLKIRNLFKVIDLSEQNETVRQHVNLKVGRPFDLSKNYTSHSNGRELFSSCCPAVSNLAI